MYLKRLLILHLAILLSGCLTDVENPIIPIDQRLDLGNNVTLTDKYPYPDTDNAGIRRVYDLTRENSSLEYRILSYNLEAGNQADNVTEFFGYFANIDGKFIVLEKMPELNTCVNPANNEKKCEVMILELTQDRKILSHSHACSRTLIFAFSKIGVEAECTGNMEAIKFNNLDEISTSQLMCTLKLAAENSSETSLVGYWKEPVRLEVKDPCAKFLNVEIK
jgi:hypothetical protein